jgi:hypothetical protein
MIKPPRALWVPFDLGRPLGPPNNAAFQRKVLMALLKLLEATAGPLLVDFPDDEPESPDEPLLPAFPVFSTQIKGEISKTDNLEAAFRREITSLRPWYDMSVTKRKRTTVGLSGIGLEALGEFIYAFAANRKPENPRKDIDMAYTVKFAVEDLKAYYIEAIIAQPGQEGASGQKLQDWLWDKTKAGEVLLELKKVCEASSDKLMSMMGTRFIVPGNIVRSKGK